LKVFNKIINNFCLKVNKSDVSYSKSITKPDCVEISSKNKAPISFKELLSRLHGGLTKQVVKELDKIESPTDFVAASYNQIMNTLKYSERIRPQGIFTALDKNIMALYLPSENRIYFSSEVLKLSKPKMYNVVRHEIKHTEQIYDGLRTQGFSETALNLVSENSAKTNIEIFKDTVLNSTEGDFAKQLKNAEITQEQYDLFIKTKHLSQTNPDGFEEFLRELYKADLPNITKDWANVQKMIIEDLGMIKAGTPDAKTSEELFRSMLNPMDLNSINYYISPHELDAYGAGSVAYFKYLFSRLF